jgi:pimeloyl-ACP methyl ester carboxylesterase
MRLRTLLCGLAAGAAGTALANRTLAGRAGALPPALVGTQHTYRWRGFDVEYTEAGDPADPDVVLFHSIHAAGTSQEFDGIFEALAEEYHVLAPDLPGFGRSSRPGVTYTAALYEEFLADFGAERTENAVCIATSLTGAYAARVAEDAGFSGLVLIAPTTDTGSRKPLLRALFRSPVVGEGLFNLLASKPSVRLFDRWEAYADGAPEGTVDYQWRSAHREGARFAPASFIGGYLTPDYDAAEALADLDVPVTLVWGRDATRNPLSEGRRLARAADAKLVAVGNAKLLPHAEHPERFLDAVGDDLP